MMAEGRSMLRMALLAAIMAVVLAAAMIVPLGQVALAAPEGSTQATPAPGKPGSDRGEARKIESMAEFANSGVRCSRHNAWEWRDRGFGGLGRGWYQCRYWRSGGIGTGARSSLPCLAVSRPTGVTLGNRVRSLGCAKVN